MIPDRSGKFSYLTLAVVLSLSVPLMTASSVFAQEEQDIQKLIKKKSFMEDWFPFLYEKDDAPRQGDTLQAPFSSGDTAPNNTIGLDSKGVEYKPHNFSEDSVSLDKPHRQPAQVERWSSERMVDAFNFDPYRAEAHMQEVGAFMTPFAQEALKTFLVKDNLTEALKSNNLMISSVVYDPARTLNQGPVQSRYRWLVDVPVTLSFMPRGANDYTNLKPKSIKLMVRMQVGRVETQDQKYDGMIIETMEINSVAQ
ncbi:MAG: DotI/IcmL family type IV secretion protein [Micavibrio sp.]